VLCGGGFVGILSDADDFSGGSCNRGAGGCGLAKEVIVQGCDSLLSIRPSDKLLR